MRHHRHIVAGVMRVLGLLSAASAVALILATAGGGSARRASAPVTLAVVPNGVYAVAQDGGRVAWGGCRGPIVWNDSKTVQLGAKKGQCAGGAQWLAIAGKRVLWAEDWGGNNRDIHVFTASLSDPKRRRVGSYYETDFEDGLHFGGIAGAGKTLAYTTVPIARLDSSLYSDCVGLPVGCRTYYGRGQTVFMAADGRVSKRGGGGIALAASQDSVALARVGKSKAGARYTGYSCRCSFTPDWSPDGKSLALAGGWASVGTSIFVQSAKGFQRVTTGGVSVDADPRWSPDGTRLAFDRDGSTIYVVRPGDAPRRLTTGYQPDWSPDGSRIVFARSDIFTMDSSGGSVRRLVGGENGLSPRWSPDGSRIAFVRDGRIYTVPAAGGEARLYSTKARGVVDFDWSRSGDRLAFWGYGDPKVHILDAAKGVFKTIGPGMFPSWSRDGRLAYSEELGAATRIVDGDGNLLERLVPPKPTAPDETIEVRRARGGGLVASFVPRGDARSLGLSKRFVAAAVQTGSKCYRVQIYSLPSGRLIRDVATSARVNHQGPPLVAVSGSRVVYSDGPVIRLLDARTGERTRLAVAEVAPSALSISGNRVVWAENREGKNELLGFVRAITIRVG